jgi:plastocyanin
MARRSRLRSLVTAAVGFALVGCSPAGGNRAPIIEMTEQDHFFPASARIGTGGSVIWWNLDRRGHHLEFPDGRAFDVEPGDVVETRFDRGGQWVVHDSSQSEMLAVVTVGTP